MNQHQLVAIAARCFICDATGVVLLEKHLIAECGLDTPVRTICGHCGTPNFPRHHNHQAKEAA